MGMVQKCLTKLSCYLVEGDGVVLKLNSVTEQNVSSSSSPPPPPPLPSLPSSSFQSIKCLWSCLFTADGTVWAWGANKRGQLGFGEVQGNVRPTSERGMWLQTHPKHRCGSKILFGPICEDFLAFHQALHR